MLSVRDIKLHISETEQEEEALKKELLSRLGVKAEELKSFRILKESVDARKKGDIYFNYQLLAELRDEEGYLSSRGGTEGVSLHYSEEAVRVSPGSEPLAGRIVVVGFGPAGIFSALTLARAGYRPLVVERGSSVEERTRKVEDFWAGGRLDAESNVQFGEGGAGTFSDGKLTTRIKDPRVDTVIKSFIRAGAPRDISYLNKPHVGTDLLKGVVRNIRKEIIALGGEVRFGSKLEELDSQGGRVTRVRIGDEWVETSAVILAIGHSARDSYAMLKEGGVAMEAKAFAVGLRAEHLQRELDEVQYGPWASHPKLKASEYSLAARTSSGRGVYSFCMCPGGRVVNSSSEEGRLCVNGMSFHARDLANANAAIVVSVTPEDFGREALDGIAFQRDLEEKAYAMGGGSWRAPVQLASDYLKGRGSRSLKNVMPSVGPDFTLAPVHELLPAPVTESLKEGLTIFGRRIRGFDRSGVLTGVETRTSAPVRILRGSDHQSLSHQGLYPTGEGAGYAGGIVSAAVDGIKAAEAVIGRFDPS